MKTHFLSATIPRRAFLQYSADLAALAAIGPLANSATTSAAEPPPDRKSIGIQVGSVSFVDEGAEHVLDLLQDRGAIDTIYLTTFTYGRGLAGRQIPGQPFPDHGVQESDENFFHGGNYATPHPEFYRDTILKQTRAPDHGALDIVDHVLPAAKQRGLRIFCSIEDVFRADVPGVKEVAEVDLQGRQTSTLCLYHPDVRAFWTGLATDLCTSYDIDGILFFNERNGPLLNALGASHAQRIASVAGYVLLRAPSGGGKGARDRLGTRSAGISETGPVRPSRARGRTTERWLLRRVLATAGRVAGNYRVGPLVRRRQAPGAGRSQRRRETRAPGLQVGFHIEHVNSFNPIFRATRSYADLATKADFLKVVVYNNCGGERYANFIRNVGSTVFRDVPQDELLRFNNHLLNYGDEARLEELATAGLSPDYVSAKPSAHWPACKASARCSRASTSASRPAQAAARPRPTTPTPPWPPR